jgi:hypothetical protein
LAAYFFQRKRNKLVMYRVVRGELLFILCSAVLCTVNWPATLVVFILPFIAFRLVAMAGNWVQHAFVRRRRTRQSFQEQHHVHQREVQPQVLE